MSTNPFSLLSEHGVRPLCPWQVSDHIGYYVPVDHTEEAFLEFKASSEKWELGGGGNAVLISGEAGCGKSSLAHRCAFALKQQLAAKKNPMIPIINLLEERFARGRTVPQKISFAFDSIRDYFSEEENVLSEADCKSVFDQQNVELTTARRLSSRLAARHAVLILLAPPIELEREIAAYLEAFLRPRICLIMESNASSVGEHCKLHHGTQTAQPILQLAVGKLQDNDGIRFKNARLSSTKTSSIASEVSAGILPISDDVMVEFLKARTNRSFGLSIRELEKVCEYAYAAALRRGAAEVEYRDIASYYVENAVHG